MGNSLSLLDLLLFPVTGPLTLAQFAVEKLHELVDRELYDAAALQERLLQLHMSYELGELSDAAYEETEAILLQRLRDALERRRAAEDETEEPDNDHDGSERA